MKDAHDIECKRPDAKLCEYYDINFFKELRK